MDLEDVPKSLTNQLNHGTTMNTHTDAKHSLLVTLCTYVQKNEAPLGFKQPYWDCLGIDWCSTHLEPNSHIAEGFHIWCDLSTKDTYCLLNLHTFHHDPSLAEVKQVAGYKWTEDGDTYLLSNVEQSYLWCDVDDWTFGPFFEWDFNADGSLKEPCPEGHVTVLDEEGGRTFEKLPEDFDVFEKLIELGLITNSGPDVTHLEKCLDA